MTSIETSKVIGVRQHIGPASNGRVAVASPQLGASCLNGSETGRASCVDAQAGTGESEVVAAQQISKTQLRSHDTVLELA